MKGAATCTSRVGSVEVTGAEPVGLTEAEPARVCVMVQEDVMCVGAMLA